MKHQIDPQTINSILIVRLSAIGDVIHAMPVLTALRNSFPKARIGWIVEELSAPLLDHHPYLDQVYVIPKKRWKKSLRKSFFSEMRPFFKKVSADGWDVAIDLQGLSKSGLATWSSGAKIRIGYGDHDGREINKLFTNYKVRPSSDATHVVERNLELLGPLGVSAGPETCGVLGIQGEEKNGIREKLKDSGWDGESRLLALNPGAGWSSKKWPTEHFAALGKMLHNKSGFQSVILWGPGEEGLAESIEKGLAENRAPVFRAPRTSIRELAVLISVMDFFVGGDTGPTHMAGMLGVPTVSLFGASDGHRNRPWPESSSLMIQREDLDCVPCWDTVCSLRDDQNLQCLKLLSPEMVMEKITAHFSEF